MSKIVRFVAIGACALGLIAASAPVASGASGDHITPTASSDSQNMGPATGPASHPAVAKKDRWAVVNADGTLARGKDVVSITHSAGQGFYIVFFDKDVTKCLYVATIGLSGSSGTSARGFITTVGAAAGATGVFVTTDDIAGNPAERGFHMYVGC